MKLPELTNQDGEDLEYVTTLKPAGVNHRLNLADEAQYRFFMRQVEGSGATPEKYPRFFSDIETARNAQLEEKSSEESETKTAVEELADVNLISGFGSDDNNLAAAQGFSSIFGGTYVTQLSMQVFDVATGQLLASNLQQPTYGQGKYEPIQAKGTNATQSMRTVFTYSYTTAKGPQQGTVHYTTEERPAADPAITEPTQKANHTTKPYIVIGLSRGLQSSTDVDYWFNQTDWNNPNVTVPFFGNVVFNSNIIQPLDPNTNFQATMYVVKPASGGAQAIILPTGTKLIDYISINAANPKQLDFKMPSGPNRGDGGTPATFGKAPWSSDTVIYFHFMVAVKTSTSGQDFVFANVVSKDQADTDPIDGTLYIKPLQFVWHCLTEGSLVKLEGGETKPVELLTGGERVPVDRKGSVLTVEATIAQRKDGPVFQIRTKDGGQVTLTGEHPLIGPDGAFQAQHVKVGNILYTEKGESEVDSIEELDFHGGVFNVSLGVENEDPTIGEHGTTLIVGGVIVGDMRMHHTLQQKLSKDPEHILRNLPEEYHLDFKNSLQSTK